jgi:hypothetical protein
MRKAAYRRCISTIKGPGSSSTTREGQTLRTETIINNTRDVYVEKSLRNLSALRKIAFQANRRLLQPEHITHDWTRGV